MVCFDGRFQMGQGMLHVLVGDLAFEMDKVVDFIKRCGDEFPFAFGGIVIGLIGGPNPELVGANGARLFSAGVPALSGIGKEDDVPGYGVTMNSVRFIHFVNAYAS